MTLVLKKFLIILTVLLVAFMVSNPTEQRFLSQLAEDYGSIHHGIEISKSQLLKMGEAKRKNYLFFSTYDYRFGNIGVTYFGLAWNTFQIGSYSVQPGKPNMARS